MTSEQLADALRLSVGRLARRLRQQSLAGLTPSQRSVLATLSQHGPMTMGRLAELEGISRPSATGVVSRLVERGLIERSAGIQDRRCSVVALTDEGRSTVERGRMERNAFLVRRLDGLSPEERSVLSEASRILTALTDR